MFSIEPTIPSSIPSNIPFPPYAHAYQSTLNGPTYSGGSNPYFSPSNSSLFSMPDIKPRLNSMYVHNFHPLLSTSIHHHPLCTDNNDLSAQSLLPWNGTTLTFSSLTTSTITNKHARFIRKCNTTFTKNGRNFKISIKFRNPKRRAVITI